MQKNNSLIKKIHSIIYNDINRDFQYTIKEGWDYYVVIVDNETIYRFPKENKNVIALEKEKQIMDIVKKYISITIPQPELVGNFGFKYKRIKGDTIEDVDFNALSGQELDGIIKQIILFLKELHSIPTQQLPFSDNKENDYSTYKNNFKKEIHNRLTGKIEEQHISRLKQYIDLLFDLEFEKQVLVHTDIQAKNIIFDYNKNKISGIIDFSDCKISGIEQDFVHFLDRGEDIFNKIVIGYLGYYDKKFVNTVKFLRKKPLIFEIMNDDIYKKQFDILYKKIINFNI